MIKKLLIILFVFIFLFSTFIIFFLNYSPNNHYLNKKIIKKVSDNFNTICIENNTENITTISDLSLKVDELTIVGVVKISKINFEGLVYEGTSSKILDKGVGHFECSPLTKRQYLFSSSQHK